MMIGEYREKVNAWVGEHKSDLFIAGVIFLVGLGSFGLGRLSAIMPTKPPLTISGPQMMRPVNNAAPDLAASGSTEIPRDTAMASSGKYVGSISGTAYHFPWCPGAQRIKEGNKIWFQTKEEAEAKGYKPAGNCPGL